MISVIVGQTRCLVSSSTDTEVVCQLESSSAGAYPVQLSRLNQGYSNKNVLFKFELKITSLSQYQGNINQNFSSQFSLKK